MAKVRVIEVHENVFNTNNQEADALRKRLKDKKVTMINVMSSPGSGKTTLLSHVINEIKDDYKVGVMDVDIETSLDAQKVADFTGVPSIQIHNGGLCHIDAEMTTRAVDEFGVDDFDLLFLENIGNLVCPAEFDTGASINITILSVPEGDDKPAKYPLVYTVSDVVLINKIDTLPVFDFNKELVEQRIHELNPNAQIFYISSKKDEGFEPWINYLKEKMEKVNHG